MSNITTLRTAGRQTVLSAHVEINFSDMVAAGAVAADTIEICAIPKDAIVTSVVLEVPTKFVHATSTDLTMAVGSVTATNAFIAATDIDNAAVTAVSAIVPVEFTASDVIAVTLAGTGLTAITAGKAIVIVNYIQKNRSNEVHE